MSSDRPMRNTERPMRGAERPVRSADYSNRSANYSNRSADNSNRSSTRSNRDADHSKIPRIPASTAGIRNKQVREMVYQNIRSEKIQQKFKKRLDAKQQDPEERTIQVPHTIENTKIKNPLEIQNQNDQEIQDLMQTDEFADYFKRPLDYKPKVLITSSRAAGAATINFINALVDLVPNSEYIPRGPSHLIREIVEGAIERSYTAVVIVGESNKVPIFLSMVNLPDGPTAYFKLSSIQLPKQIYKHGNSTDHNPELVLNNFTTHLGFTVGRFFASLFPKSPQFRGRQIVTFHNQRDFVFVRRHRYKIDEGSETRAPAERVDLQEIGPKFCLKLLALQKGTYDRKGGSYIWERKPEKEDRKKFYL